MATVLDPPSASELISMVPPDERDAAPSRAPTYTQQTNYSRRSEPVSHMTMQQRDRNLRPEREPCPEHPDEEVNYFCFDCMSPPVCSECVVHGTHKGHDVSTLKKAYPQIMANIDDLQVKVNSKIDELQL